MVFRCCLVFKHDLYPVLLSYLLWLSIYMKYKDPNIVLSFKLSLPPLRIVILEGLKSCVFGLRTMSSHAKKLTFKAELQQVGIFFALNFLPWDFLLKKSWKSKQLRPPSKQLLKLI